MQQDFPIKLASPQTMRWFYGLAAFLIGFNLVAAVLAVSLSIPWLWAAPVILLLVLWLLLIHFARAALLSAVIELGKDSFRIRGDLFSRRVPLCELIVAETRVVDFVAEPVLKPKWKLWGIALPGHQAGFFSLHNGQRAYVFLNDTAGVVFLRTCAGRTILLTPSEPEAFVAALKSRIVS